MTPQPPTPSSKFAEVIHAIGDKAFELGLLLFILVTAIIEIIKAVRH